MLVMQLNQAPNYGRMCGPWQGQGSALALRPSGCSLPDGGPGLKRLHSSSPPPPAPRCHPLQSAQPQMGMQEQRIPPFETNSCVPLAQTVIYNNTTVAAFPWVVPGPQGSRMNFGGPRIPFPVNPLHLYGLGHLFQDPVFMQPQIQQPIRPFVEQIPHGPPNQWMNRQCPAQTDSCPLPTQGPVCDQLNKPPQRMQVPTAPATKQTLPTIPSHPAKKSTASLIKQTCFLNQTPSNKSLTVPVWKQTIPNKPPQPDKVPKVYVMKQTIQNKLSDESSTTSSENDPRECKFDQKYSEITNSIYSTMVSAPKAFRNPMKKFAKEMKQIINARLQKLTTKDPSENNLEEIYRKAYPRSTDDKVMKEVLAQLNLPEFLVAIAGKSILYGDTTTSDNIDEPSDTNSSMDLTKYICPGVNYSEKEPSNTEKQLQSLIFQSSCFISSKLLKPNCTGVLDTTHSELAIRPYLRALVEAELRKFPPDELLAARDCTRAFWMYHERTAAERSRRLVDAAVLVRNAQSADLYRGVFSRPDKAAFIMDLWPEANSGETTSKSNLKLTDAQKEVKEHTLCMYAAMVVSSETFELHKAEYDRHEVELDLDEVLKLIRDKVSTRMSNVALKNPEHIVSTPAAVEAYRRFHPVSTDLQLMQGVIQEMLNSIPRGDRQELMKHLVWPKRIAAVKISNEVAFRRQIEESELKQLSRAQRDLHEQLRQIVMMRLARIIASGDSIRFMKAEKLIEAYRKEFPWSSDEAFVRATVGLIKARAAYHLYLKQWGSAMTTSIKMKGWLKIANDFIALEIFKRHKSEYDKHRSELKMIDVLKHMRAHIGEKMKTLSPTAMEQVASAHGAAQLYRRFNPARTDLELMRAVIKEMLDESSCQVEGGQTETEVQEVQEEMKGEGQSTKQPQKMKKKIRDLWKQDKEAVITQWVNSCVGQLSTEVLYGDPVPKKPKWPPPLKQDQIYQIRGTIRRRMNQLVATRPPSRFSDLHKLYRARYPPASDAELLADLRAAAESPACGDVRDSSKTTKAPLQEHNVVDGIGEDAAKEKLAPSYLK